MSDEIYIRSDERWFFIAVLLGLFSRQVGGWQLSIRIDRKLVCDALQAAILTRGESEAVMVHSDQSVQYATKSYRAFITQYNLTQSMSPRRDYWDKAVAESFSTMLKQGINRERF